MLVGKIHQDLGALPRLAIFEGDVVVVHGLADVHKVALDGLSNGHRADGGAQALGQGEGILEGAVGGAKARHGYGQDFPVVSSQKIKGAGSD